MHQKFEKLSNLVIFRAISIITVGQPIWRFYLPYNLTNVTPGARREPPADTKYPPAAQRKQAKRACLYIYSRLRLIGPLFNRVSRLIGPLLAGPE